MNDPNYLDVTAFVDNLDFVNAADLFDDVASIDFADVGIDSNEIDKADKEEGE